MNLDLCLAMVKHNVDLVVIEGMGRTLHTNLYAKMKCECLKLAVVKNRWLALRLGGDMYAVICKYERPVSQTHVLRYKNNDGNELLSQATDDCENKKINCENT